MKPSSPLLIVTLILASMLWACGGGEGDPTATGASGLTAYIPAQVESAGLEKVSEVRTFVGDSLWEYINGGAELYHTYGFSKVYTADYKSADAELVLDLYQFDNSDGAYGLYAALRPDQPELVTYGVEGYVVGTKLEFVKGDVMVRIIAYEESDAITSAMKTLAAHMASALPGTSDIPTAFNLFPGDNAIAGTDRIVGQAFLGQSFLNMIYQRDYLVGSDTISLFLADDRSGTMFARWIEAAGPDAADNPDFSFDEDYYFMTPNSYYGDILVGLKNEKLAGVVNYSDQHKTFIADWLISLPAPPKSGGD